MKPQGRDTAVIDQPCPDLRQIGDRLVASRDNISQIQTARPHGHIDRDIRALGDDGHALLDPPPALLIRPKQRAIKVVDKAVAIRAKERHVTRRRNERVLQTTPISGFGIRLGKPGGKTHSPARSHSG